MNKTKVIVSVLLTFSPFMVFAKDCSDSKISEKKILAGNIEWTYEYYLKNNEMFFDLTVSNVYDDLYVKSDDGKTYSKKEFQIKGLRDNQKLSFEVISNECKIQVLTKEIYLPKYNKFYGTSYCEGISEFSYCGKWNTLGDSVTLEILENETNNYRQSLNQGNLKATEYKTDIVGFYVFITLIMVALTMLLFFLYRKKTRRDFI